MATVASVAHPAIKVREVALATRAPFHLEATVRVLQRRPTNLVDIWRGNRWERMFATSDGLVLAAVENRGSIDAPDVRLTIEAGEPSATTLAGLEHTLRVMLGLDLDPAPLAAAAERLHALRPTALALRGMRPPRFVDLFEVLLNVVPFQQLSLDAGAAILGRLVERFGKKIVHGGREYRTFPMSAEIASARSRMLVACGFSRSKAESLRQLAALVESGALSANDIAPLPTAAAGKALAELPGIGPWSAALILLRGFGRLEVFPPNDSGATRGLTALLRLRAAGSLDRVVARFGPLRGYLYFCGLGSRLLAKRLISEAPQRMPPRSHER
jgi:3-methyladenine DNA glycosylase/8-oxoguanine DNA glycosylase